MANAESKKLTVDVIARIDKLEKGMARASQVTNRQFSAIESRAKRFDGVMNNVGAGAFGAFTKGAFGLLAPILGVAAAVNTAKDAMKEFGDIADSAKAAGLDSEFFQGLAYQAGLGGVAIDALSTSLATFNRNSGLAVVNKGKMAAALKALNPELLANIQAATSQDERVRLAADAIAKAGTASERAALSVALFGDAGAKLADVFSGGSNAIAAMANEAKGLGLIIDRDLIAKADELGDKFDTATKVMDLQFKQALIDLAPFLIGTAKLAGDLAAAVNFLSESMQGLADRSTSRLQDDFDALANLKNNQATGSIVPVLPGQRGYGGNPDAVAVGQQALDQQMADIQAELRRRAINQLRIGLTQQQAPVAGPDDGAGSGSASTRNAAADAAIRQAQAIADLVDQYGFEGEQLGRNAQEQELYNALRQAGVGIDTAAGQAIAAALGPLQQQREAIAANTAAMEEFSSITKDALSTFFTDLSQGKSLAESFGDVLANLGNQLLQSGLGALFGNGSGANPFGIIGQAFGFADGGIAANGRPKMFANGGVSNTAAVFGEAGPEAAVPLPDGRRIPVDLRMPQTSGQGRGSTTVTLHMPIDATGADAAGLARVERKVAELKASLPGTIKQVVGRRAKDIW